jgi:molybdopterin converting factor subunit 1
MRVKLLYFGVLKELMGREGETLEIAEGANVGALYDQLRAGSSKRDAWPTVAVAVNREYAGLASVLHEGDEVALLPPVSGGCCAHGER